jgi:hypothetical protein
MVIDDVSAGYVNELESSAGRVAPACGASCACVETATAGAVSGELGSAILISPSGTIWTPSSTTFTIRWPERSVRIGSCQQHRREYPVTWPEHSRLVRVNSWGA